MTMPSRNAERKEDVQKGLWRYEVEDDRIQFESDSYAVWTRAGVTLIDPLPVSEDRVKEWQPVHSILLSASCHQRAAWEYRRRFHVKVYGPQGGAGFEERPDEFYRDAYKLPGGIEAVHAPGPTDAHYAFHIRSGRSVLIVGDLMLNDSEKGIGFIEAEYQDDPAETRRSVVRLLRRKFAILCFNHGAPLRMNPKESVRELLKQDARMKEQVKAV